MRMLDRGADPLEKLQALGCVQLVGVAVFCNWLAFDVFHHEVRQAIFRSSAVEKAGDIRLIEIREDLSFHQKAPQDRFCIHATLDDF